MGGCYSAAGHGATISPRHKLPKERSKRNGKLPKSDVYVYGTGSSIDELEDSRVSVGRAKEDKAASVGLNDDRKTDTKNSDSGIGSVGSSTEKDGPTFEEKLDDECDQCQQKILRNSRSACEVCGEITFKKSAFPTYCSCGPRTWQSNQTRICATHPTSPKIYRNSDIVGLKSSLKKHQIRHPERKNHLSWKSSDSLDYVTSMCTSMDRAKSEASDIFRDDVSFRAPLAAFDSVDDQLESTSCIFQPRACRTSILSNIDLESSSTEIYRPHLSRSSILSENNQDPGVTDTLQSQVSRTSFHNDINTESITKDSYKSRGIRTGIETDENSGPKDSYKSHGIRSSTENDINPELNTTDIYKSRPFRTSIQSEIEILANSICRCEFSASDFVKSLESGPVSKQEHGNENTNGNCNTNSADQNDMVNGSTTHGSDSFIHQTYRSRYSTELSNGSVCTDRQSDIVCNGMDNGHADLRKKPAKVSSIRQRFSETDDGLLFMSLPSRDELTTMVVDGREVVLVDVDVYDQIMNGLAQLRSNLSQLSTVIQESEDIDSDLNWAESYIQNSYIEDCQDQ